MFSFHKKKKKITRHAKRLKQKKYSRRDKRDKVSIKLYLDIAEILELSEKEFRNNYD